MKKHYPFIYWLPVVLYYSFITYLSGSTIHLPSGTPGWLPVDKIFHFLEYSALGLVLSRDLYWRKILWHQNLQWKTWFVALTLFFIVLDEVHQSFVPGRMMDVFDGVADFLGACFGALVFMVFIRGHSPDLNHSRQIQEYQEKDKRRFSLFAVLIVSFIVLVVNLVGVKQNFLSGFSFLIPLSHFFEWFGLGWISYHAIYLNNKRQFLKWGQWILFFIGFGLFCLAYAYVMLRYQKTIIPLVFYFWFGGYFALGVGIGIVRNVLKKKSSPH